VALTLLFGADPGIMTRATKLPTSRILWDIFLELLDSKYPYRLRNNALDLLPIFIATEASNKDQV
jgi:hypothetical protein